uniref:Uncharacterized protein n=1 Tax=Chenopodium quinoa TaxID=63459 RepID=A0A803L6B3_CHEQI
MEGGMSGVYGGGDGGSFPYHHHQALEGGVLLSRDPKPRLRWTPDLHERFVDAVTKLGGPDSNQQDHKGDLLKIKHEAAAPGNYCSLQLNLNNNGSSTNNHDYDFGGSHGAEFEAKLLAYRR